MREKCKGIFSLLCAEHWQVVNAGLIVYDILAVNAAFFLALWVRFDCVYSMIPIEYMDAYLQFAPFYTVISILIFWRCRLYQSIWRFASYSELLRAVIATIGTAVVQIFGTLIFVIRMPISYYLFGTILQFFAVLGIRFSYRFILLLKSMRKRRSANADVANVMIIGAGAAGQTILKELTRTKEIDARVCCFIDDNPNKWNRYIEGVPVVGGRDDIMKYAKKMNIDRILYAIPNAKAEDKREILNICQETDCELKALPGIYQLVNGEVTVAAMKEVTIDDLLGRPPIESDMQQVYDYLQGKKVLITGAGGSIGSVAALQVAGHHPKQLILFDMYENNIYDVEHELKTAYPELDMVVLIGSVRDSRRISQVFETYKPDVVYHAAAHKHVPLMEISPNEAIKNNAIGTYKTAYAAMINGCQRFVLISTDKAVNPTNIMGASKRICEMIVQTFDHMIKEGREDELPRLFAHAEDEDGNVIGAKEKTKIKTEFVAVRFGNVLGSNGSVIPLFKRQIAMGGPVTVTHPDIIRYFMTIPEAVNLVLQCGALAQGGEIFILDMGEPVKIINLAENMIRLSGLEPGRDIEIKFTGLRPGEKLYEELLINEDHLSKTSNNRIFVQMQEKVDEKMIQNMIEDLVAEAYDESADIRQIVQQLVPEYTIRKEEAKEAAATTV